MLQAGQIFHDRYQLQTSLGQNPGRQTWLAKDLTNSLSVPIVIKFLAVSPILKWEDLDLFEREAKVLKYLDHPQIPKYLDYFAIAKQAADLPWFGLVQTYIPSVSLEKLILQGTRFSQAQSRKTAIEILRVLVYLHELSPPVLHRDIKPSNLVWGENQQTYLVDFGAVQDCAKSEGATFTVVGTYGYTPLEQFRGQTIAASDLYALGATLIHLLTGIAPAELSQNGLQIEFRDRVKLVPSFAHWLEVMTDPAPEHRFKTARQALGVLEREVDDAPLLMAQRPRSTRVKLNIAPDRLLIEIPRPHFSRRDAIVRLVLFALVFKLLSTGIDFFSSQQFVWSSGSAPWQISLALAIAWGLWLIGAIDTGYGLLAFQRFYRVQFDRQQFTIRQQWQNWCYQYQKGQVKDILDVVPSVHIRAFNSFQIKDLQAEKEMLMVQTVKQKYYFGIGLTTAECVWISQEIETWLLLQKYRDVMAKNKHLTPQNLPQSSVPQIHFA